MALKEELVPVVDGAGKEVLVTLGTFNHKQRKDLNRMVSPTKVNPNNPMAYEVETEKLERYQDEYLKLAIKDPPECASYGWLNDLPDQEFNKLQAAAQRLNGDDKKVAQEAEKKSEGPSNAASAPVSSPKNSPSMP